MGLIANSLKGVDALKGLDIVYGFRDDVPLKGALSTEPQPILCKDSTFLSPSHNIL